MGAVMAFFMVLSLTESTAEVGIQYFEADERAIVGRDWSVWFIPRLGARVSSVKWDFRQKTVISCRYTGPKDVPTSEYFFTCSSGCKYHECRPEDSFGMRVGGSVFSLYAFRVTDKVVGDYALTVNFYGNIDAFEKTSTLSLAIPPALIASTLVCNFQQLQEALRSTAAVSLESAKLDKVYASLERQIEGNEIHGSVKLNPGSPEGKTKVFLIRHPRHGSYPYFSPCNSLSRLHELKFTCLPSIEDVGLAILTFNVLNASYSIEQAEDYLKNGVMERFGSWVLQKPSNRSNLFSRDFGTDQLVTPLKMGWSAVVHVGQNIRMFCPLNVVVLPDKIECKKRKVHDLKTLESLSDGFWIDAKSGQFFFQLRKKAAELTDSGIYECHFNHKGVLLPVCTGRRLTVLSDLETVRTFVYKKLVPAKMVKTQDLFDQYTENSVPYLLTNQSAYIVCWIETAVKSNYTLSLTLTHEVPKPRRSFPFALIHTLRLRKGMEQKQVFKFYRCTGYGKARYGGNLRATCSITKKFEEIEALEQMKDNNDLRENTDLQQIASNTREILMLHAADGNLSFYGSVNKLQEHPVPLGTTVHCTGAKGFPPPTYQWSLVTPRNADVFVDSPDTFPQSAFMNDRLEIPNDPRYRGMSFLFRCKAFNELVGRRYHVERLLLLTVSICDNRFVSLDLSLIYSPQMVAGHVLLGPRGVRSGFDFYSQRYVHLLSQIILGLAQGPDYVKISTVPISILSPVLKKAPLYAAAQPLTHKLSPFELSEGLISKDVRPESIYRDGDDPCPQKIPVDLTEGFHSVAKNLRALGKADIMKRRPFAVLLPRDRWDKGDVVEFIKRVRSRRVRVISVYFEKPSSWAKESPDFRVQLTKDDVFGETCANHSGDDRATFLERLPLFDAICSVARPGDIYETSVVAMAFLSHSQKFTFEGERMTYFSAIQPSYFATEERHLRVCIVDQAVVANIEENQVNQEYLDSKCEHILGETAASQSGQLCLTISINFTLNASHDGALILSYDRGVHTPFSHRSLLFISSVVQPHPNTVTVEIRLNHESLKTPYLLMKQFTQKAYDSAEFECIFEMTRINYQIDLVYWSTGANSYVVVARTESTRQGFRYRDIGRKVTARLIWPAVPMEAGDSDIHCVLSSPKLSAKKFALLPSHSSNAVRLTLIAYCPQRPKLERIAYSPLTGEPDEPRLGARMSFVCEALMGEQQNYSLQMAFASKDESFVICSEKAGGGVNTTVPCTFTTWQNGGCGGSEKIRLTTPPKGGFASCSISYGPQENICTRTIELTIPLVTIKYFDAFVFCETLPTTEVDEDSRLLSNPIDNLFPISPTVTNIDIGYYEWTCEIIAYPPPSHVDWRVKEGDPWKFYLNLNRISFEKILVNSTRAYISALSAPGFFPKNFIPSEATSSYYLTLSRPAPSVWQVGTAGTAKLVCEVANSEGKRTLKEVGVNYFIGKSNGRWAAPGSLYPKSGVVNLTEPWAIACPIMRIEDYQKTVNLFILRKVHLPVIGLVELPLLRVSFEVQKEGKDTAPLYFIRQFKPVGWWSSVSPTQFRVEIVDTEEDRKAVKTQLSQASDFDTGSYVCRFYVSEAYNDADVSPELFVVAKQEQPILAHKVGSGTWTFAGPIAQPLTLFEGDLLETRCLIWRLHHPSTSASGTEPFISQSSAQSPQVTAISNREMHTVHLNLFSNYDYYLMEYSWKVNTYRDTMKYIGCYWSSRTVNEKETGRNFGPLRVCGPSNRLKVIPEVKGPLQLNVTLRCNEEEPTFNEPNFYWVHKVGPIPRLKKELNESQQHNMKMHSSVLKLSDLPSPGFYVFVCRAVFECLGKKIISEKHVPFTVLSSTNSTAYATVKTSPRMVLTPGPISVECPGILTENSGLITTNLTWFRLHRQTNLPSPESHSSAFQLSYHDLVNGTAAVQHPNFTAHTRHETEGPVFVMTINPSDLSDFGYYGCAFGAIKMVGDSLDLIMSQVSAQPVCLVVNTTLATIKLSPFRSDACYRAGDVISVECDAMAYQAFCDENDKPLGVGLISTVASLTIAYGGNEESEVLHIASSKITVSNPPKKYIHFAPASINVSYLHNEALVTCEVRPEINNKSYNLSSDWKKIESKLLRNTAVKLCVFFPPSNIIVSPPPPDRVDDGDVTYVLKSEEWVTCLASGNPAPVITLDAFPLKKGALAEAARTGLPGISRWRDPTMAQPKWPTVKLQNGTGTMMQVTKEANAAGDLAYVGVCYATNIINGKEETAYKLFIFRIRDATINTSEGGNFYFFVAISCLTAVTGFVVATFLLEFISALRHISQKWQFGRRKH